jgi:CRISPR-associated endonuclease Csn1
LKDGYDPCPLVHPEDPDYKLIFKLNPNDLVFVPDSIEFENSETGNLNNISLEQLNRVYRFTDGSGTTMNFVPVNIANLLFNIPKKEQEKIGLNLSIQNELGVGSPQSKNQKSIEGIMIKEVCWKLQVNRLGQIISTNNNPILNQAPKDEISPAQIQL